MTPLDGFIDCHPARFFSFLVELLTQVYSMFLLKSVPVFGIVWNGLLF